MQIVAYTKDYQGLLSGKLNISDQDTTHLLNRLNLIINSPYIDVLGSDYKKYEDLLIKYKDRTNVDANVYKNEIQNKLNTIIILVNQLEEMKKYLIRRQSRRNENAQNKLSKLTTSNANLMKSMTLGLSKEC